MRAVDGFTDRSACRPRIVRKRAAIIVVDGVVWYNESGVRPDALVRFDPKTETFQSWAILSGGVYAGIWRHGRATREGNLLIHQSATNRIIQVTPKQRAASR